MLELSVANIPYFLSLSLGRRVGACDVYNFRAGWWLGVLMDAGVQFSILLLPGEGPSKYFVTTRLFSLKLLLRVDWLYWVVTTQGLRR